MTQELVDSRLKRMEGSRLDFRLTAPTPEAPHPPCLSALHGMTSGSASSVGLTALVSIQGWNLQPSVLPTSAKQANLQYIMHQQISSFEWSCAERRLQNTALTWSLLAE